MAKKTTTKKKATKAPAAKPKPVAEKVKSPPVVAPPEEIIEPDPVEEIPQPELEDTVKLTYHKSGNVIGIRNGKRMDVRQIKALAIKAGHVGIIAALGFMKVKHGKTIEGPADSVIKARKKKK